MHFLESLRELDARLTMRRVACSMRRLFQLAVSPCLKLWVPEKDTMQFSSSVVLLYLLFDLPGMAICTTLGRQSSVAAW